MNKKSPAQTYIHAHREQTPGGRDYLVLHIDHGPGRGDTRLSILVDQDCRSADFDRCFPVDAAV